MQSAISKGNKIRFYTYKKGKVGLNLKNTPLMTKDQLAEYEWMSNFYPAPIELNGFKYPDSETFFQSERFRRNPSGEEDEHAVLRNQFADIIASAKTPNTAFKLAQYVQFTIPTAKKPSHAYVSVPFPPQYWMKELIMDYYDKGLVKFREDHADDLRIMLIANRAKFTQNPVLREKLIATGDAELIEHTKRDNVWGDGGDGSGKNELGKILMQVRDELK
jgi:predicted NAD-dependent protein-ADP-ribosyltransferase YbiA (DUF1768 family)